MAVNRISLDTDKMAGKQQKSTNIIMINENSNWALTGDGVGTVPKGW